MKRQETRGRVSPPGKVPRYNRRKASNNNSAQDAPRHRPSLNALLSLLKFAGSIALVVGLVGAGYLAYRHARSAAYFSARDVRVSGNRTVTSEEIIHAAGLQNAPNLLALDTVSARRSLLEHPWIAEARIATRLPRTVSVEVVERRAAATVILDVPYLVDERGDLFKRFTPTDAIAIPIVTGFDRAQFSADETTAAQRLRDALDLARRYRKSALEQTAPLAEVHCEPEGGFSLVLGDEGVYVRLGRGPYRHKLQRLATLLGRLQRDGRAPAVVYMDNEVRPDRITVTPRPAAQEAKASRDQAIVEKRVSKI